MVKLAAEDPDEPGDRRGHGRIPARGRFYQQLPGASAGRWRPATWPSTTPRRVGSRSCSPTSRGATQGDQIAGCSVAEARLALAALARVHAPVLGDLALGATDWLNQPNPLNQALLTRLLPAFLERYGERISPEHAAVCERFVASIDGWARSGAPPLGLVHGDYRLDNLLFDARTAAPSSTGRRSAGGRRWSTPRTSSAAVSRSPIDARTSRSSCASTTTSCFDLGVRASAGSTAGRSTGARACTGSLMTVAASMIVAAHRARR